ncbi:hypothetical protein D0Y65_024701 [Glycine soja]|uniref:Uncharacterized protein n=1 Tax=Glycine soja TaxID=3848 RepID=A0A445J3H9_GLYSO|nr:hypothetical protein D0Y65_024701 [Glycine soja]
MPWIFLLHHYNLFFLSLSENPNPGSSFAPLSLSATTGSGIKVLEWKDSMLGFVKDLVGLLKSWYHEGCGIGKELIDVAMV